MLRSAAILIGFLSVHAAAQSPPPVRGVDRQVAGKAVRNTLDRDYRYSPNPDQPPLPRTTRKPPLVVARPGQTCSIPLRTFLVPTDPDPRMALPAPKDIDRMPNIMPAPPCPDSPQ